VRAQRDKWLETSLERMRRLDGYAIEETVERLAQRFGISPLEVVKLNSNENFFIPKNRLHQLMREVVDECDPRIYPQEEEYNLEKKIGDYLNISSNRIAIGNGSDQLIELIARLLLNKGDRAVSITPTFPMYKRTVTLLGAKCLEAPLQKDFGLNVELILTMITPRTRLLFLCSPNNPTANQFGTNEIQLLVKEFPGVVIVDEAYAEFAEYSLVPLQDKFDNLIILRTFSKAFGLAGFRLGYCVANADLATILSKKLQLPYPVSSVTLRMGLKLLENADVVEKAVTRLKVERKKLIRRLNQVNGVRAFDSHTNFVLFQTDEQSDAVYQGLLSRGILVRNLGKILHLNNCFRATVGTPRMNAKLVDGLKEIS